MSSFTKDYIASRSEFSTYNEAEIYAKKRANADDENVFIYKKMAVAKAVVPLIEVEQLAV